MLSGSRKVWGLSSSWIELDWMDRSIVDDIWYGCYDGRGGMVGVGNNRTIHTVEDRKMCDVQIKIKNK